MQRQVASSTKWGSGDNVVLRLMECLTPTVSFDIFTDNNRTSFRIFLCLPTLELTTFQQEVAQQEK